VRDHTLFVREGRWQISGSTVDVAGNPNIVVGFLVVTHDCGKWLVDEQINESTNRYEAEPLAAGATATEFDGNNGAIGAITGAYVFFEDVILTTYRSADGHYSGIESVRMLDDDRYESRGALFLDDGHVSSWSLTLQQA
jgi:hypothetical protein